MPARSSRRRHLIEPSAFDIFIPGVVVVWSLFLFSHFFHWFADLNKLYMLISWYTFTFCSLALCLTRFSCLRLLRAGVVAIFVSYSPHLSALSARSIFQLHHVKHALSCSTHARSPASLLHLGLSSPGWARFPRSSTAWRLWTATTPRRCTCCALLRKLLLRQ